MCKNHLIHLCTKENNVLKFSHNETSFFNEAKNLTANCLLNYAVCINWEREIDFVLNCRTIRNVSGSQLV